MRNNENNYGFHHILFGHIFSDSNLDIFFLNAKETEKKTVMCVCMCASVSPTRTHTYTCFCLCLSTQKGVGNGLEEKLGVLFNFPRHSYINLFLYSCLIFTNLEIQ